MTDEERLFPLTPGARGSFSPSDSHRSPGWSGTSPLLDLGPPVDESFGEGEQVATLLRRLALRRPPRVAFVPLEGGAGNGGHGGEGIPYLHGSLEVRLQLAEDRARLLVRVAGSSGRAFDIEEFLQRAEAIEAKRGYRPNTIAEESEFHEGSAPVSPPLEPSPAPQQVAAPLAPEGSSLSASTPSVLCGISPLTSLLGSTGAVVPPAVVPGSRAGSAAIPGGSVGGGGGILPGASPHLGAGQAWKDLFKSHWDSR